jgi:hypothetical protein
MAPNEDTIRRLAVRAGMSAEELLDGARQSDLSDALEAADEAKIGEMLDDAEAADRAAEQDTGEAAERHRAKAQELRSVARLYLTRMAAAMGGQKHEN